MRDLQRFATAAPDSLLVDRGFWRANRAFGLTALAGALFIIVLYPLTYPHSGEAAAWLSVLIHGLVIAGLATAARRLARIEVEDAIARLVEARARADLSDIKGHFKDRAFLDDLESNLLPQNPSYDQGVIKIFQYIVSEARDHKFHDSLSLVEALRGDGLGDLLRIQTIQRIAVQLGILGTFAGLIVALARLGGSGGTVLEPNVLGELLGAVHIAFSTSIAGLQVAIILGAVVLVVRHRQEAFWKDLETACAALVSLARHSINRDDFLVELEQVRSVVNQLSERVREQSRETEAQTDVIRSGLGRLASVKLELDAFLQQVHGEQALVLAEMQSVYHVISPRQVAAELKQALVEANLEVTTSWRANLAESVSGLDKLNVGLRLLQDVGGRMWEEMRGHAEGSASAQQTLRETVGELTRAVQALPHPSGETPPEHQVRRGASARRGSATAEAPPPQLESLSQERLERRLGQVAAQLEGLAREVARNTVALHDTTAPPTDLDALRRRMGAWLERLRLALLWLRGTLASLPHRWARRETK